MLSAKELLETRGLSDLRADRLSRQTSLFRVLRLSYLVSSAPWFQFLLELEVEIGIEELEEGGILHPTLKRLDNVFEIGAVYFNLFMLFNNGAMHIPCVPSDCDF